MQTRAGTESVSTLERLDTESARRARARASPESARARPRGARRLDAQRLNFQLVYVTRHPLTVIRATQEWIEDKQSHGKHKQWDTSVAEIAKMWRKSARLATEAPLCVSASKNPGSLTTPGPADGPRCTFAAMVRYVDHPNPGPDPDPNLNQP